MKGPLDLRIDPEGDLSDQPSVEAIAAALPSLLDLHGVHLPSLDGVCLVCGRGPERDA